MSTLQDILYAKALADAQYRETDNTGMAVGALTGTALGAAAAPVTRLAPLQERASYGVSKVGPRQAGARTALAGARAGNVGRRLAGGLVGAIVGGALGEGVKRIAMNQSPAASMLAKIQANGGAISPYDQAQLEAILREIYTKGM